MYMKGMKIMNKKEAWNKFKESGRVEDYLDYVKIKEGK